jgi:hypothetical protein
MKKAIVKSTQSNDSLHLIEIDNLMLSISIEDLDQNVQDTEDEELFLNSLWSKTIELCKKYDCDEVYCFESEQIVWSK